MSTPKSHRPLTKPELIARNPVARALHIYMVDEPYKDKTMVARVDMYMREDGADATDLLAILAVVIGSVCQLAAMLGKYESDHRVKLLHGALRTVQSMCLQGYTWQSIYAPALCNAMDIADELALSLRGTPEQVTQAATDAEWFAGQIMSHSVTAQAVAGKQ